MRQTEAWCLGSSADTTQREINLQGPDKGVGLRHRNPKSHGTVQGSIELYALGSHASKHMHVRMNEACHLQIEQ